MGVPMSQLSYDPPTTRGWKNADGTDADSTGALGAILIIIVLIVACCCASCAAVIIGPEKAMGCFSGILAMGLGGGGRDEEEGEALTLGDEGPKEFIRPTI